VIAVAVVVGAVAFIALGNLRPARAPDRRHRDV
jgi:hypothetical protein